MPSDLGQKLNFIPSCVTSGRSITSSEILTPRYSARVDARGQGMAVHKSAYVAEDLACRWDSVSAELQAILKNPRMIFLVLITDPYLSAL